MTDRRTIERPSADSEVSTDAVVDRASDRLTVFLHDVLQRPEGAGGPDALTVQLAASAPIESAASSLGCERDAVLDIIAERWDGRGADLLSWVRRLSGAEQWSGPWHGAPDRGRP